MRIIAFLFFLFIPLSASCTEEFNLQLSEFIANATCSDLVPKSIEVKLSAGGFIFSIPSLYDTPIISSTLVCYQLLTYLHDYTEASPESQILTFEVRESSGEFQFLEKSGLIDSLCLDAGLCQRGFFDYFRLNQNLLSCHGARTLALSLERALPKFYRTKTKIVKKMGLEIHPFVPFIQKLEEYLNDPQVKNIYASTMSLGDKSLVEVIPKLNTKFLNLSFDAGLMLMKKQENLFNQLIGQFSNFQIAPMTSGQYYNNIYHLKFITSPENNKSVVSSMNLSTPESTTYIDFLYLFDDSEIQHELTAITKLNKQRSCQTEEDLKCLLRFANSNSNISSEFNSLLKSSCLNQDPVEDTRSGYFAYNDDTDLEQYIIKFINSAEKEIILMSYKLSNPSILSALRKRQAAGLKVYLITAYKPYYNPKLFDHLYYAGKDDLSMIPYPHMKLMISDREQMLFGSGNFSVNALTQSAEMFGTTTDQNAIQKALAYAATFVQDFNPKLSKNFYNQSVEDPFYSVNYLKQNSSLQVEYTEPSGINWMPYYRKFNQQGKDILNQCKINNLHFVSSQNFQQCLDLINKKF